MSQVNQVVVPSNERLAMNPFDHLTLREEGLKIETK
jgi:hypothetical protein